MSSERVKFTLELAMKAQRWSRGIALLSLYPRCQWDGGGGVNSTPRPFYPRERDPVPIIQEALWVLGQEWTGEENLAPRVVQPLASRHAVYTIPAPNQLSSVIQIMWPWLDPT
jgi:hypothetical protein